MAISGTGTQADPYIVDSVAALLQKVQENSVYIKIAKDLDCYKEDTPWKKVYWNCKNVDGQNHKIDNIYAGNDCIQLNANNMLIEKIIFNITCDSLSESPRIFLASNYYSSGSINSCRINLTLENTKDDVYAFYIERDWIYLNNCKIKVALKGKIATFTLIYASMQNYVRNSEILVYTDDSAIIDEMNILKRVNIERCRVRIEVPECNRCHIIYSNGQISSSYFIGNIGTDEPLFNNTYYTIQNSYIALKNHKSKVNISTNSPTSDRTTAYNAINTFINAEDTNIVPVGSFIGLTEAQCKDPDYLNSIRWYVK